MLHENNQNTGSIRLAVLTVKTRNAQIRTRKKYNIFGQQKTVTTSDNLLLLIWKVSNYNVYWKNPDPELLFLFPAFTKISIYI